MRPARLAIALAVAAAAGGLLGSPPRAQEASPPAATQPDPSELTSPGEPVLPERTALIRRILASTAQLRTEREGGGQRAASGVVLARDRNAGRVWILTTLHFLEPPRPQKV